MAMNCFQFLSSVLDETWDKLPGSDADRSAAVATKAEYLSIHYGKLHRSTTPVDYADPATRYAYVQRYVASHANLVYQIVKATPSLKELFEKDKVKVTCVGGGPGSDLLGILKYVETARRDNISLKFWLYDAERSWADSWSDVDEKLEMKISTYFVPFDVTQRATWNADRKYLESDLFTMIYFASEIHRCRADARPFFENLFDSGRPGALVLYIDNNAKVFFDWFDEVAEEHGMEVVVKEDDRRLVIPPDEEKSDLGVHFARIPGSPKLQANVAIRVLRKPNP